MRQPQPRDEYVRFFCEDCHVEFEIPGTVVEVDREGGLDFVPGLDVDERVDCPLDLYRDPGSKARYSHDISLVGAA